MVPTYARSQAHEDARDRLGKGIGWRLAQASYRSRRPLLLQPREPPLFTDLPVRTLVGYILATPLGTRSLHTVPVLVPPSHTLLPSPRLANRGNSVPCARRFLARQQTQRGIEGDHFDAENVERKKQIPSVPAN